MRARRKQVMLCLALVLIILSGVVFAQSEPQQFVPFSDFVEKVNQADFRDYQLRPWSRVTNAASFEQMRQHVLTMYQNVEITHSFVLGGQHFDCVPIEEQPSVRILGIKATAVEPPSPPDLEARVTRGMSTQLDPNHEFDEFGNSVRCEEHTVPMRRITLEEMTHFGSLQHFFDKSPGEERQVAPQAAAPAHKYAVTYQNIENLGGNSGVSLWSPHVATSLGEIFSLSQQWYSGGTGASRQTAEAGWQNYPGKYHTQSSVLFIFWTRDNYVHGCYNLDCPAFVQTNNNWYFGGTFDHYSTLGGDQYEIQIEYYLYQGNWWLELGGQWVGYYPGAIYQGGQMSRNAQVIEYGGETVGNALFPPMGSGLWPTRGLGYAAFHRNVFFIDTADQPQPATLTTIEPSPACYKDSGPFFSSDPTWAIYFWLGGPGGRGC